MRIGVPRALFYHYYYPTWVTFFSELGAEVVLSPVTNRAILDAGVKLAVDEVCLPVKLYYGHVVWLADKVDMIFAPRLVSVEPDAFTCPKFMGLPDMLRAADAGLPPLIDVSVNLRRKKDRALVQAVTEVGRLLTRDSRKIREAWDNARIRQHNFDVMLHGGYSIPEAMDVVVFDGEKKPLRREGRLVGLVGHGYNLYDRYTSMDIIGKLQALGARVITPDNLPPGVIEEENRKLPKKMFWSLGKKLLGGTSHFLTNPDVQGIIHLASFGCGPDSLVGDLVERFARRTRTMPFLYVNVDEHTGEAGVTTRVEAFMDMIAWRGGY